MNDEIDEEAAVVESLVGRTIVAALWLDEAPDDDWCGHEAAYLTLDDGRVIRFGGWGHDAWGATVSSAGDAALVRLTAGEADAI